ncbi:MAG: response regulator transcription factor [Thermoclostridium sp.]|nr:response regulator transcription factor [Thermoclostridium sp.]
MNRILVIEDDEQLSRLLELELTYKGYEPEIVSDGYTGINRIQSNHYDLVLLDVMLPGIDGLEVCRRIRLTSKVPVIMLTAKDNLINKVMGLDSGADDYVTKPFSTEELLARIRAALRRNDEGVFRENRLSIDGLTIDIDKREVIRDGKKVILSKREFDLLEYMMINKNIVLTRDKLLENIWGYDFIGDSNTVDVYIRYLRSKIDDPFEKKLIYTYRGVGYSLKENEDEI